MVKCHQTTTTNVLRNLLRIRERTIINTYTYTYNSHFN